MRGLENRHYPRRAWLAGLILEAAPSGGRVLEFGCGYGPNLLELASKNPTVKLTGIEINPESVLMGRRQGQVENARNIQLINGGLAALEAIHEKQDVMFTDTALMYLSAHELRRWITKALALTTREILHLEFHHTTDPQDKPGHFQGDGYIWDFLRFYTEAGVAHSRISIISLPEELCGGPEWKRFASLIRVTP